MSDLRDDYNEENDLDSESNFWDEIGIPLGSYDQAIDLDILNVITEIASKENFYTDIAKKLNLSKHYIQLIQYIICSKDFAEYGCSPRGCWLTREGEAFYKKYEQYHKDLLTK